MSTEEIFTDIYVNRRWGGFESRSGKGSDLNATETLRQELPLLLKELEISTMLDIPCGDYNWMKEVDLDSIDYIGADIVSKIISDNQKYENEKRKFVKLDLITQALPKVDLILCRDVFIHFSFKDIIKSIKNIKKSNSTYLLTNSYPSIKENKDIRTGRYHYINFLLEPFSFPKPLRIMNEEAGEPGIVKKLYLWKVSDFNDTFNQKIEGD